MGRDTSKQAKKKAASASSEYVSKIHDLSVQKIELKETEGERKAGRRLLVIDSRLVVVGSEHLAV
jgi:hypothetical protein